MSDISKSNEIQTEQAENNKFGADNFNLLAAVEHSPETTPSIVVEKEKDGSIKTIIEPLSNGQEAHWCLDSNRRELYNANKELTGSTKISLVLSELLGSPNDEVDSKNDLTVIKTIPKSLLTIYMCEAIEDHFNIFANRYSDKLSSKQLEELVYEESLQRQPALSVATLYGFKNAIKNLPNRSDSKFDGITRDDIAKLKDLASRNLTENNNPLINQTEVLMRHFNNKQSRFSDKAFPDGEQSFRIKNLSGGMFEESYLMAGAINSYAADATSDMSLNHRNKLMSMIKDNGHPNYTVTFAGDKTPIKVGPLAPAERLLCASSYENGYWLTIFDAAYRRYLRKHPDFDKTDETKVMKLLSGEERWYLNGE